MVETLATPFLEFGSKPWGCASGWRTGDAKRIACEAQGPFTESASQLQSQGVTAETTAAGHPTTRQPRLGTAIGSHRRLIDRRHRRPIVQPEDAPGPLAMPLCGRGVAVLPDAEEPVEVRKGRPAGRGLHPAVLRGCVWGEGVLWNSLRSG